MTDPELAERVRRIAQSPLYATKHPGKSLNDALVRLGMTTVSEIVLELMLTERVFRVRAYATLMDALRRHAVATAHMSRAVAIEAGFPSKVGDRAFVCGLVHDAGVATALFALSDRPAGEPLPDVQEAWTAAVGLHERIGAWLGKRWRLPSDVAMTMGHHHAPQDEIVTVKIVSLAEALASASGQSLVDEVPLAQLDRGAEALEMTDAQIQRLGAIAAEVSERLGTRTLELTG